MVMFISQTKHLPLCCCLRSVLPILLCLENIPNNLLVCIPLIKFRFIAIKFALFVYNWWSYEFHMICYVVRIKFRYMNLIRIIITMYAAHCKL